MSPGPSGPITGKTATATGHFDFLGSDSSEDVNGNGKLDRYILPTPPDAPRVSDPGQRYGDFDVG